MENKTGLTVEGGKGIGSEASGPSPAERFSSELVFPSFIFAIIGIALLTFGREAFRYPTTLWGHELVAGAQSSVGMSGTGSAVVAVALLFVAALLSNKTIAERLFSAIPFGIAVGVMSLAGLCEFANIRYGLSTDLLSALGNFCSYYLFGAWAYRLYWLKGRTSIVVLASAFFLSGLLQIVAVLLRSDAAQFVGLLSPIASALAFALFQKSIVRNDESPAVFPGQSPELQVSAKNWDLPRWYFGILIISFVCYGLLSFTLHSHWNGLLSEDLVTAECQIAGGLGVIGFSLLLLWFSNLRTPLTSNLFFILVKCMIFCVLALGVCDALFQQTRFLVSLNFLLLDSSHKLVLTAIWAIPLYVKTKGHFMRWFFFTLGAYQAGACLFSLIPLDAYAGFLILFGCLAFVSFDLCIEMCLLFRPSRFQEQELSAMGTAVADYKARSEKQERILFRAYLEETYSLTKREVEILEAVSSEMTLKDISSTLFISPETAKAHRRNALKKLGVSSSKELKVRLDEIRETEFRQYLNSQIAI